MNCFGFGTTFSPPVRLDLTPLMHSPAASQVTANTAQLGSVPKGSTGHIGQSSIEHGTPSGAAAQHKPSVHVTEAARSSAVGHNSAGPSSTDTVTSSCGDRQQPASHHAITQPSHKSMPAATGVQSGEKLGLAVTRSKAKVAKDALKALGWLDQSCKAHTDAQTGCVCLPITDEASTALASLWPRSNGSMTQHESASLKPGGRSHAQDECTSTANEAEGAAATKQSLHGCMQDGITSSAGTDLPIADGVPLAGPQSEPKGSPQSQPKGSRQSIKGDSDWERGPEAPVAQLLVLLQCNLAVVKPMRMHTSCKHHGGPAVRLRNAVTHILQQQVPITPLLQCLQ